MNKPDVEGILLIDKPAGKTAFGLVACLRRKFHVRKIGHAGTLDPFATGVMVMLIGKPYTKLSDSFLNQDKEYEGEVHLGVVTDTQDPEGTVLSNSDRIPTLAEVESAIEAFQGEIEQIPPMYSAKKVQGQKLYELARKGKTIERKAVKVSLNITLIDYTYPHVRIRVACSKGTYIRTLAHDLGEKLGCGAHLSNLRRLRSGVFRIQECIDLKTLESPEFDIYESAAFFRSIPER